MMTLISFTVILLIYIQSNRLVFPNNSWTIEEAMLRDGIVYCVTFAIIALISWLSNHEMEKALKRARSSEQALRKQRDIIRSSSR